MTVKSEKSSFLRKMHSKIWNCQGKNIWGTLEDVKSNSGQLLFSVPCWFFHSFSSYKGLNISKKNLRKIFWLLFSKLSSSFRSGKINMVQKTKVVRNSILHLLRSPKYFLRLKYFFLGNFKFLNVFFSKRTTSLI